MKWCITGGCGFIGTSLVRALHREGGHTIRVLDDLSVGTRADLAAAAPFVEAEARDLPAFDAANAALVLAVDDIRDTAALAAAASGADVLVHLAANTGVQLSVADPRADCDLNVIGTLSALEAAREARVGRFVFASSGAPLAGNAPPVSELSPAHPVAPYGASKLAGEGYCLAYFHSFGVETVTLRFGNVYGPYSSHKSSVVAKFVKSALAGVPLEIYGDGTQTRDFIYIDDLVAAITRAASAPGIGGEIFQIASAAETTINELVATMLPLLKASGIADARIVNAALPPGDAKRNYSDTRKAAARLGWMPKIDQREGLSRTIRWFAEQQRRGQ